jgi:molybdopterin-guanine dinucleotide biosynthesis protein A
MAGVDNKALDPFFNVNTPEELAEAEAVIRGERP